MIRGATLLTAVGLWLTAAVLLWRTGVPGGLRLPHVDARSFPELARSRRHDEVLRWLWAGTVLVQLGVLAALARRPPRAPATVLAALALLAWWAAGLPFALVGQWWENRYGLAHGGYGSVLDSSVLLGLALGACAVGAIAAVARRVGRAWWLVASPLLVGAAALLLLVSPLLIPHQHPLGRGVYVEDVSGTSEANAEAVGIGPTQRIVVWDTLLDGRFSPAELRFVLAHERTHERRRHVLKGLAWFALFVVAGTFAISRAVRLEEPGGVPRALLAAFALQLALLPLTNAIARRYETEADWGALQRTRDPAADVALMHDFARTSLEDPDPPGWSYAFLDNHPTLAQRAGLAEAWLRARDGPSRAGS